MPKLILLGLTINLYARGVWLSLNGDTLNPGVMIVAAPLALLIYVWILSEASKAQALHLEKDSAKKACEEGIQDTLPISSISLFLVAIGTYYSLSAYDRLALNATHEWAQWARNLGFTAEGLGLIGLWLAWTRSSFPSNLSAQLYYPLAIALYALPWEFLLRTFDHDLQEISTDLAVGTLDLIDLLYTPTVPLKVAYWDRITLFSDRFYLIVNETCAGVNLLVSMSLYALGFSWVMGLSIRRAAVLIAYILPLCQLFNGLRIAMIFCLGHFGGQALATGLWHEGSAYISQALLFLLIALINMILEQEPRSAEHGP